MFIIPILLQYYIAAVNNLLYGFINIAVGICWWRYYIDIVVVKFLWWWLLEIIFWVFVVS